METLQEWDLIIRWGLGIFAIGTLVGGGVVYWAFRKAAKDNTKGDDDE